MAIEVTMPKLSDTMEEGKILRWLKRVGEPVKIGEVIAEVETDKANLELESYDEGVLSEVKVQEGDAAPVGAVIAVLEEAGKQAAAPSTKAAAPPPKAKEAAGAPAAAESEKNAAAERGEKQEAAEPTEKEAAAERGEKEEAAEPTEKQAAAERGEKEAAAERGEKQAPAAPAAGAGRRAAPAPGERAPQAAATPKPESAPRPEPARELRRPAPVRPAAAADTRVHASPLARRIAEEHRLDLGRVTGTGPGGRIVERDVQEALATRPEGAPARSGSTVTMRAEPGPTRREAPAPGARVELTRIRRTTAKRMAEAKREVPHFYASTEILADELVRLKDGLAALGDDYDGITFTHLLLKALGLALRRVPELNASYDGDAMVLHERVNVGLATAVDDGLVVPVVHDCDREPVAVIVRQVRGLVERARAGRFAGDDLTGGTFTLSNLGMFPVADFAAVINPPQAGILAVGAIRDAAVVRDGHVEAGRMMTVTLSCDHRIIDGVIAGRFLRELKSVLEQPLALIA